MGAIFLIIRLIAALCYTKRYAASKVDRTDRGNTGNHPGLGGELCIASRYAGFSAKSIPLSGLSILSDPNDKHIIGLNIVDCYQVTARESFGRYVEFGDEVQGCIGKSGIG